MDFTSHISKEVIKPLKEIDVQLAYLALLTCEGIKPMSRWEKPLQNEHLALLSKLKMSVRSVHRTVKTGKTVTETIFSRCAGYLQLYETHFAGTNVNKSARTQRLEGFLFGYPPCCVDEYIRRPYAKNNLASEDQKILFHWACRDCKITPLLLSVYKNVYDYLESVCIANPV